MKILQPQIRATNNCSTFTTICGRKWWVLYHHVSSYSFDHNPNIDEWTTAGANHKFPLKLQSIVNTEYSEFVLLWKFIIFTYIQSLRSENNYWFSHKRLRKCTFVSVWYVVCKCCYFMRIWMGIVELLNWIPIECDYIWSRQHEQVYTSGWHIFNKRNYISSNTHAHSFWFTILHLNVRIIYCIIEYVLTIYVCVNELYIVYAYENVRNVNNFNKLICVPCKNVFGMVNLIST